MNYEVKQFSDLFKIPLKNGLTKPKRIRGEGIKFINMGELYANDRIYDISTDKVPVTQKELGTALLHENDLLFARQSLVLSGVGKCSILKEINNETTYDSHLIRVRLDDEIACPDFYYYYFSSPQGKWYIQSIASQVAAAGIKGSDLKKLEVPYPPLPTQRRIAAILSSLDDKIENNRKTAEKLEEIAQALFKRWFVDFEFPNKDGKPYKSSGGEMVYCDELGKEIPVGWEIGAIKDCCDKIQNGGTPRRSTEEFWNSNDIPWLTSGEVREKVICRVNNYISQKGFENSSAKKLPLHTTVVALYGATAGQVALLAIPTTTNQAVCGLVAKKKYTFFNYILLSLSSNELFNKAIGSAQQNISKKIVEEFTTVIPDELILSVFDKTVSQLYFLIMSKLQENLELQQTRDALLPKLMSGEIEVEGIEV